MFCCASQLAFRIGVCGVDVVKIPNNLAKMCRCGIEALGSLSAGEPEVFEGDQQVIRLDRCEWPVNTGGGEQLE
jgi:hypothetical protein